MKMRLNTKLFTLVFTISFSILILFLLFIFLPKTQLNSNNSQNISLPDNYVTRVIDGDTFQINSGETIRLLCVDTPEKNQTGYEEATSYLESLILYKEVNLIPSITDKDKYRRLLSYVYVSDSFINKMVLYKNYGELLIISPENCSEIN
jgi:micrococcal nuclease